MANQVTKLSDVINPQVMGAMIEAKISALCKLTPYAKVDTTLQGVPVTPRLFLLGTILVMHRILTLKTLTVQKLKLQN